MNVFKILYYRTYQTILKIASNFLYFHEPCLLKGKDALAKSKYVIRNECKKIMIVTGNHVSNSKIFKDYVLDLEKMGFSCEIFKNLQPNPTIKNVEDGVSFYKEKNCNYIIAFGGGSVLDCAKLIGARIANPKTSVLKMKGLLKLAFQYKNIMLIPTTAGTGSECTVAAVVVDEQTNDKFAINDPKLIPDIAILDPINLLDLPKDLTAYTGMDALTHALEAYIGKSNTKYTKTNALEAIKIIFENLKKSYDFPHEIEYRENMLIGSYKAGCAFTRAYIGYVHALAHSLGGFYNVQHGYANAVLLPYVLESYGKSIYKKMGFLYDYLNFDKKLESNEEKCKFLIKYIFELNDYVGIPKKFDNLIKEKDLPSLINHALKEANPLYPVPKELDYQELEKIYRKVM